MNDNASHEQKNVKLHREIWKFPILFLGTINVGDKS